jgi:2-amino-4-hydroxy-6-hydroxymethyldihydropteridine diphosphokinase
MDGVNRRGAEAQRRVFLGLGSNVGDREGNLRDAIARLRAAPGVNFLRQSRVYQTEPIGVTDQPEFLNMVVEVEVAGTPPPLPPPRTRRGGDVASEMSARELLALVKQIETEVGRKQRERWGPREIDIDVLLFGDEHIVEGDLEVPHPRMWERAFVLAPLAELAPEMKTPGGETVAEAAARLGGEQGARPLSRDGGGNGCATRKRWWQKVWDWLPSAVLIVTALWCVGVPCVWGLTGPYSATVTQFALLLLAIAAPIWAICVLATVVMLVVHWVGGRPGVGKTIRRLRLLAASAALFWVWGPPFGFYLQGKLKEYGLRRAVTARVSIEELRGAAATMVNDARWGGEWRRLSGRDAVAETPGVPQAIARLEPERLTIIPTTGERIGHVILTWNPDWNVEVGPPGFHVDSTGHDRWADGVYGFIALVE